MIIKKTVEVSVDIDHARKALMVAGYYDVYEKSDDEVFQMALNMNHCYAVKYENLPDRSQETVDDQVQQAIDFLTDKCVSPERQEIIDEVNRIVEDNKRFIRELKQSAIDEK